MPPTLKDKVGVQPMITIYLDTTQGVVVSCDDLKDVVDDGVTKNLVQAVADAASQAYDDFMGIGEVMH